MPYILNTESDIKAMLKKIGARSIGELYAGVDSKIKLKEELGIPEGISEYQLKRKLDALAAKNKTTDDFNSFLGAGCYDHYIPYALQYIISNSKFLTAYTPYQAECSQGVLQAIYEYQTYMCILTGMEVSNASLLDGASSLAEAALMALRIRKGKKIVIAGSLNPEYYQTLRTYLSGHDFVIEQVLAASDGFVDLEAVKKTIDDDTACCVVASPNFFGLIEDVEAISKEAKSKKALMVMVANPLSLALLKAPKTYGVDIVCGEGQPLGGSLNFGGPGFGFLAAKGEYIRQMPGRIVGKTADKAGNTAYCLTLQAREQHIRREKATSNICSNQSLNVIAAAIYLSLMGENGLRSAAKYSFNNTQYLYERLKKVRGVTIPFVPRVFNEFVWQVENSKNILNSLYAKGIIGGYYLGEISTDYKNCILSCCTEKKTKAEIDTFVNTLGEVLHG
jgi:glycine cleavage system P protein (glycine dehydrogenase) subunit 1